MKQFRLSFGIDKNPGEGGFVFMLELGHSSRGLRSAWVSGAMALAVNGSGKRVREASPFTSDGDRKVRSTCNLDLDILECPICIEPLSPPVYQCRKGHQLCAACHVKILRCPSCSEPIGHTRCLLAEKILESLQVSCKYASHGCKKMLKCNTREEHIKSLCSYRPCPCPVSKCMHKGPKQVLAQHLEKEHKVPTFPFRVKTTSGLREAKFTITEGPAAGLVLLKDDNGKIMLLHWEVFQNLAYLFFCTTLEGYAMKYDLRVSLNSCRESYTMRANASAEEFLRRENWKRDTLLFVTGDREPVVRVKVSLHKGVRAETNEERCH